MKPNVPKRINDRTRRDFWAYVKFRRSNDRTFCPWPCGTFVAGLMSTIKCFSLLENGITDVAPKQPRLLRVAVEGKRLLNWQIKQWASGVRDGVTLVDEIRSDLPYMPDWVWIAVKRQASMR